MRCSRLVLREAGTGAAPWDALLFPRIYEHFLAAAARAVLARPPRSIAAARDAIEAANTTLYGTTDWRARQLPYWRLSFDALVMAARAWATFRGVVSSSTAPPAAPPAAVASRPGTAGMYMHDASSTGASGSTGGPGAASGTADSPMDIDAGIAAMRRVVAFEARAWHPEAGPVWDAREQLATMLLLRSGGGSDRTATGTGSSNGSSNGGDDERSRNGSSNGGNAERSWNGGIDDDSRSAPGDDVAEALQAYKDTLQTYPNRYRPLAGAAALSARLGHTQEACVYYGQLLNLTAPAGLPGFAVNGSTPTNCSGSHAVDRRPELKAALAYVRASCNNASRPGV